MALSLKVSVERYTTSEDRAFPVFAFTVRSPWSHVTLLIAPIIRYQLSLVIS